MSDLISVFSRITKEPEGLEDKAEKVGTFCGYPASLSFGMREDGSYRVSFSMLGMTGSF